MRGSVLVGRNDIQLDIAKKLSTNLCPTLLWNGASHSRFDNID